MASEEDSSSNRRRAPRPAVAGIVVLLVVGMAVALPVLMDPGCASMRGATARNTQPMELSGRWLGLMLVSSDSATARNYGIPNVVAGVVVAEVARDTRGAVAGVAPGDVIVKVDGTSTQNLAELYTLTTRLNVARPLALEIMRQGQTAVVTLPAPVDPNAEQPMAMQQPMPAQQAMPAQQPMAMQQPVMQAMPQAAQPMAQQPISQPATPSPAMWPVVPGMPPSNGAPGTAQP
jgi:hypothetical protein